MIGLLLSLALGPVYAAPLTHQPAGSHAWARPGMCGVNCLYVLTKIMRASGETDRDIRYGDLESAVAVHPGAGTSLAQLEAAAKELGLEVESRRVSADDFPRLPMPFIAHLDQFDGGGAGHFVTIYDVLPGERRAVLFVDGANGQTRDAGLDDLKPSLSGFVLVPARSANATVQEWSAPILGILGGVVGIGIGLGFVALRSCAQSRP